MATGFKVADAYVDVHIEDGTKKGRDQIGRDSNNWANREGERTGRTFMQGMARGILSSLRVVAAAVLKVTLLASIVGVLGAALSALGGYVVQATAALAGLVGVLGQAAGALLLLPGVIFTLVSSLMLLKLAFSGMGAALKAGFAGDVEALNKAMKDLSPNAQKVVKELVALKPAWLEVKKAFQDQVFKTIAPEIKALAKDFLPMLRQGLAGPGGVGEGFNAILNQVLLYLRGRGHQKEILGLFTALGTILKNLSGIISPLLNILVTVGNVVMRVLGELSGRLTPLFNSWAVIIDQMAASGKLEQIIHGSFAALKQLGGLLADLWGIIAGISRAAGSSSAFTFFDKISKWINSVEGQQILVQIFQALRTAADALSPALFTLGQVFGDLLTEFASVMVAVGPTLNMLVGVLGDELVRLIPLLIPLLLQVGDVLIRAIPGLGLFIEACIRLVTAAGPGLAAFMDALAVGMAPLAEVAPIVGEALGELVKAIAPLLKVVGPLLAVLLAKLATDLTALAIAIAPTITLGAQLLSEFLVQLLDILVQTDVLTPLVDLFKAIADNIRPLIPLGTKLIADFFTKLMEVFERNRPAIEALLPKLVEALVKMSEAGVELLIALAPLAPVLGDLAIQFVEEMLPALIELSPVFLELVRAVTDLLTTLTKKDPRTGYSLLDILVQITIWMFKLSNNAIILAFVFQGALAVALSVLTTWLRLATTLFGGLADAAAGLGDRVGGAIKKAVEWGQVLYNAGREIIEGLIRGLTSKFGDLRNTVTEAGSAVGRWFKDKLGINSPSKVFMEFGRGSMEGYILGLQSEQRNLQLALGDVAAALPGAFQRGTEQAALQAAGVIPSQSGPPQVYVKVQIGERPVRDMVHAEIVDNPDAVATAADEGHRTAAFAAPARKRVGAR